MRITGKHWSDMLAGVVQRAATGLGVSVGVVPEFYKMPVYDEGSFFVSHRDPEKSAGMFATLILALPNTAAFRVLGATGVVATMKLTVAPAVTDSRSMKSLSAP